MRVTEHAMQYRPLTLAIALMFGGQAYADTAALEEVIVTAPRAPSLTLGGERLPAKSLASLRAVTSDAATLLLEVPGVGVQAAGGVSSLPIMRGLADDRLRVKLDGMDLIAACPNHMNAVLSYLDPTQVEAIDVYAGLSPVSVGGDSLGGSILVRSVAPKFAPAGQDGKLSGSLGGFYRSNGNGRGLDVAVNYGTPSFGLNYAGGLATADNYQAGGKFKQRLYSGAGTGGADPSVTGRVGHTLALDEVGSTAYEARNHSLGLAFKGGPHLIEAKLGIQDLPYQLWPNQRMDMLDNQDKRINFRYQGDHEWGRLEGRVYYQKVDHSMDFGADKRFYYGGASGGAAGAGGSGNGAACSPPSGGMTGCAWGMPMYTASDTTGLGLQAELRLRQGDLLRLGAEYQRYRLDDWWEPSGAGMWPYTFWNIRNGERSRAALYGEWEGRPAAAWQTLAGLRYERVATDADTVHGYNLNVFPTSTASLPEAANQTRDAVLFNTADRSRTDHNWDLTLLAKYALSPTQDIAFGYAHKTRSPNLYERYAWSTWQMAALMVNWFGDGNGYIGNLDLQPEQADTISATFSWHAKDRGWAFKATPYYTWVRDYIDAVRWDATNNAPATAPLPTNQFAVLKFMNQSARIYGLDLSGELPLGQTTIGDLGLKGRLSYAHGKNRATGEGLYNIVPLNAKLTLTHARGGWDNALEVVMVSGKSNVSTVRKEIDTPPYSLVNVRASYRWKHVRLDFGVENLFDRLYYLPNGGPYLGQGTTMTTSGLATGSVPAWGTAVPGPGRSVYIGVTYNF